MTDPCERFRQHSAELALGILDGRARAEALAHVEHCAGCQQDLMTLGDVADRLVELTPSAEPPPGFETRVLAAVARRPGRARHRSGVAVRMAVAAVVASLVGLGGWAVGQRGGTRPATVTAPAGSVMAAGFVADDGHPAGQAVVYGGTHPWMAVAVDTGAGDRTVRCELDLRDGTTVSVGTFSLTAGYGYWGVPLSVAPSSVSGVRLATAEGTTLATAHFDATPVGRG